MNRRSWGWPRQDCNANVGSTNNRLVFRALIRVVLAQSGPARDDFYLGKSGYKAALKNTIEIKIDARSTGLFCRISLVLKFLVGVAKKR